MPWSGWAGFKGRHGEMARESDGADSAAESDDGYIWTSGHREKYLQLLCDKRACGFHSHHKLYTVQDANKAIGIDILNSIQQELEFSSGNRNIILPDLIIKDYPLIIWIQSYR